MKKNLFIILMLTITFKVFGIVYNVTVPAVTKACYIAGEMNSWAQEAMIKIDATHYTIDLSSATALQKYKYCSGPSWNYVENTPNGDNRSYTANDIVSSWALVYDPTVIATDVKYSVTVPVGTNVCYIAGASNSWQFQEMTKTDATHFTITINTALPNSYKYCSGPGWKYEELDAANQPIANRNYNANDVVIKWAEIYIPTVTYNVTVPSGTNACYIAGEMNNWAHQAMDKIDDTHYRLTIQNATTTQKYKYSSGPDWSYEELNSAGEKIENRSYSASDIVAKWSSIWNPGELVTPIANTLTLASGKVERYSFNKAAINNRTVDVWLPAGYTTDKKYSVLYMHDGQMLFDATQTWNNQEWKVDETISQLIQNGEIKDLIVVGVWNSTNRYSEFYPEKSLNYLPSDIKTQKMTEFNNEPKGDEYLSFIVDDLKPFIDKTYSVYSDQSNTYIAGSSMGGLISWYALCEYPSVLGGAICMSTHWANNELDSPSIPDSFRKYLLAKMPSPQNHTLYFDHGTVGLDANYPQHQVLTDTIMRFKKYSASNWITRTYSGDDHNETCWANRFNIPLKFMFKKADVTLALITQFEQKSFECGSTIPIVWDNNSLVTNVKIEFSGDNGVTWSTIAASVAASNKTFNWTAPNTALYECKIRISSTTNAGLMVESPGIFVLYNHLATKVEPLLKNYLPVFVYPYNQQYPVTTATDSQIINGKVGNACGPTAVSNILSFWEFPRKGFSSRTFTDHLNCVWSANFSETEYKYDLITDKLNINSPQAVIDANATLMYHAGVAMHDTWRTGNSSGALQAFKTYFGYNSNAKELNRDNYTPEQWEKVMKSELSLGRPQIVQGWAKINPDGSHDGHWFMCDGYSEENTYHVSYNYGAGSDWYFPLYEFGIYKLKNWIFAYLEPDFKGKKISLTSLAGNEYWQKGTQKNLIWTSTNVAKIKIEFSGDNGITWSEVASNIDANLGNYNINLPNAEYEKCKIRITDMDNINISSHNQITFSIFDTKELTLKQSIPTQITCKSKLPIRWIAKGLNTVKIEYTENETEWLFIGDTIASAQNFIWTVPDKIIQNCKIRISDKSDNSLFASSSAFTVNKTVKVGGPYIIDNNTLVLCHFNKNYVNEIEPTKTLTAYNSTSFEENFDLSLDYGLKIDNSSSTSYSCVVVPHSELLSLIGDWTIDFWFKILSWGSGTVAYPFIFFKPGANYFINLNASNQTLRAGYDYDGGAEFLDLPINSLVLNKWFHLSFTRNTLNNTLNCYIHNDKRALTTSKSIIYNPTHIPKTNTNDIRIGGYNYGSNVQFDGYIDELRISNVVRNFETTGLSEIKASKLFEISPNPSKGYIEITCKKAIQEPAKLTIVNLNGQIILEKILLSEKQTLNLTAFEKGIYFIQFKNKEKSETKKLILY